MGKRIAILGSTGSIGTQTLEVVSAEEGFCACALAAGNNWRLLAEQARRHRPERVAIAEAAHAGALAEALPGVEVLSGPDAAVELVRRSRPDVVVTAMVGAAGLAPTLAAIETGADLAIANKEPLVMAGGVIIPAARAAGVQVLPVDSEHSGVFQCLAGQDRARLRRVILTASGGPLRAWPAARLGQATVADVLNHPTWAMGPKITVDSATMVNKALEVIEAHWLFDLSADQIAVVVHPESAVHACVEFTDGSLMAQLGAPSMVTPISYALHYPRRSPRAAAARLDLAQLGALHFSPVDAARYGALELGYEVIRRGGTAGAVFNAANEVAVAAFLAGGIAFGRIVEIAREVLNRQAIESEITVDAAIEADRAARRAASALIEAGS